MTASAENEESQCFAIRLQGERKRGNRKGDTDREMSVPAGQPAARWEPKAVSLGAWGPSAPCWCCSPWPGTIASPKQETGRTVWMEGERLHLTTMENCRPSGQTVHPSKSIFLSSQTFPPGAQQPLAVCSSSLHVITANGSLVCFNVLYHK